MSVETYINAAAKHQVTRERRTAPVDDLPFRCLMAQTTMAIAAIAEKMRICPKSNITSCSTRNTPISEELNTFDTVSRGGVPCPSVSQEKARTRVFSKLTYWENQLRKTVIMIANEERENSGILQLEVRYATVENPSDDVVE